MSFIIYIRYAVKSFVNGCADIVFSVFGNDRFCNHRNIVDHQVVVEHSLEIEFVVGKVVNRLFEESGRKSVFFVFEEILAVA